MRRMRPYLLILLAALFAAPAFAQNQLKEGDQAPDFDAPNPFNFDGSISSARMRGKIILLVFWRTTDSSSIDAIPTLNKISERYRKRGVVVIAYTPETDKDVVETTIKGKEIKYPVVYGGNMDELFNVTSFPQAFLIEPAGTLVWKGHTGDDLEEKIKDQIRKTPPAGSDPEDQKKRLAAAQQALAAQEFGKAFAAARDVLDLTDAGTPQYDALKKLLEDIEKGASDALSEARNAIGAKDYERACRIIADLSVRFAGHDIGKQADDEVAKLEADRETKTIIRKALSNAKGLLRNEQAADMERQKQYAEATDAYREVTAKYEDTEAATAAKAALDRLAGDSSVQEAIRTSEASREADRWLDLGERFAKVKMPTQARNYFQKVIDTHPKSAAAEKARKRIQELPKEEEKSAAKTEEAAKTASDDGKDDSKGGK